LQGPKDISMALEEKKEDTIGKLTEDKIGIKILMNCFNVTSVNPDFQTYEHSTSKNYTFLA